MSKGKGIFYRKTFKNSWTITKCSIREPNSKFSTERWMLNNHKQEYFYGSNFTFYSKVSKLHSPQPKSSATILHDAEACLYPSAKWATSIKNRVADFQAFLVDYEIRGHSQITQCNSYQFLRLQSINCVQFISQFGGIHYWRKPQ